MPRRERGEGGLFKMKGSRFWYAQFYDSNGRPRRASTKTDMKQEALGVLRKMMETLTVDCRSPVMFAKCGMRTSVLP